ncbi:OmpA/MotB family protein [Desulfovibrio ferrophilus]|uniref:OmpA/MotB domain protein n=1 Tax=Desulfovibrio ferrophilus TaxID=241368 RepID=A0A2Z6B1S1_9BACT|nr:flagellar motor protein MotB [Desulfovibrio ferrophilus]BBD09403.1 OmpA/MotB domain protein [Desulfovibrio ferrophilus]
MARKKKKSAGVAGDAWLVTFGDLVTLLLTFFVLLLSMSSMDKSVLTKITFFSDDLGQLSVRSAGRIPQRIKMIVQALEKPWEILEKKERLKDMFFPDDVIPPEISRSTLMENLEIMQRPEGVALVLTDKLLFPSGGSELNPAAKQLLSVVGEVMGFMDAPVNVSGYSDAVGGDSEANYRLSGERALSVMEFFLELGLRNERFSVSGYGPNWALADNTTELGRSQNRRVEILLKTTPWLGAYVR